MEVSKKEGVPSYQKYEFDSKKNQYCLLIPIINEGNRIIEEIKKAKKAGIDEMVDIAICDGGSTDGSLEEKILKKYGINTLLIKTSEGKQGAQLRMGISWALERGYQGIITIDGNNKDSIEDVPFFIEKLNKGYDLIQGSRFIKGGNAINTPLSRYLAVRLIHAPLSSLAGKTSYTDTTNAFRAYSKKFLVDPRVQPLREIFTGYELLAYLSIRAPQLKFSTCEVPVTRAYPKNEATPTKIKGFKGNSNLMQILIDACRGKYNPK